MSQLTINDPYYEALLRLSDEETNYLLFSVYIWNADYIERLVADLGQAAPHLKIILGGPQAPFLEVKGCTIVHGEIEGVGDSFYADIRSQQLKESYSGQHGQMFSSPYHREDFSGHLENRNIYYESSRGCPFSCSYCLSSTTRGLTVLPIEQIERELRQILDHSPKLIKFVDRTFNADPKRALALWQFLAKLNIPTTFHFEIAPDIFSEEMFEFLAKLPPGKFQFEIGVQSTNSQTLAAVNRKMDLELAGKNIKRLAGLNNIHLHVDLILGLPWETYATFKKSVNYVFSLSAHYVQMGLLKVLPETNISRKAVEYGIVNCRRPPYQVTATATLDHQKLKHLYWLGECIEAFYNNRYFRFFFRYLLTIEEDIFAFFENLLEMCQQSGFFRLAKTQKLLTKLLVKVSQSYPQNKLLTELLIFDWLACGHRQLPEELFSGNINDVRNKLWHILPENIDGLFKHVNKNEFFKKGVFFEFSGKLLEVTGMAQAKKGGYICFLPEPDGGIFKHQKTAYIADIK